MAASIATNGYIFTLRRARKEFTCCVCQRSILLGDSYYEATLAGGGLGSLKFPERIHASEIGEFIKKKEVNNGSQSNSQNRRNKEAI